MTTTLTHAAHIVPEAVSQANGDVVAFGLLTLVFGVVHFLHHRRSAID